MRKLALVSGAILLVLATASFKQAGTTPGAAPVVATMSILELTLLASKDMPLAEYADAH